MSHVADDTEPGAAPVTVVVATRNRREELLRTLERLRDLPERPPVIVVDNASSDGSPEQVRRRFPEAVLIRLAHNLGAPARNVGVLAARTPYVAFSDDDSWWEPGALRAAARAFGAHPSLGLIAARVLVGDEGVSDPLNAVLAGSPLPRREGQAGPPVLGFLACGSVVRREAFLAAGGFSPVIFFPGEEQLLAYDMAALGWDLCYVPDVVAVHRPSLQRAPKASRRRIQARNALLTVWLRRPLGVVLRETARLAARTPRDPVAGQAVLAALLRLPLVVAGRRRLPERVEDALGLLASDRSASR
ncbi:glycosyl transferase [Sphaerisporangium melleum]|uniref:Glycosyl transferase n=1 Tax=Sphaerisporangium melleum TaxID=321316 RepID=A0A917R8F9_9ACTN|nr:glycosyltransferase [Sphaerisporangium melleum]GGK94087.1 glycosyl transferase [Sphaerisporangium melleum]GII73196.1 glycosyl transferase [Sphaerisporangium melleum]